MATDLRKIAEQEFHNRREELRLAKREDHDSFYTNRRFYRTTSKSRKYLEHWFQNKCPGRKILDYCCGLGDTSIRLAELGADVIGVDISDVSIETGKRTAAEMQLKGKIEFLVMDAENLIFENDQFDIIVCSGVLHHLDLDKAYQELARVLKPNGEIICIEALSDNPLIHWYRRRTPHLRTEWETDHILTTAKIKMASRYFNKVNIKYFHLASLAAIPLIDKPGFQLALKLLNAMDAILLKIPGIQKLAWQAIFTLSGPR